MKNFMLVSMMLISATVVAVPRNCDKCCGSGRETISVPCPTCGGSGKGGYVTRYYVPHGFRAPCVACGGTLHRGEMKVKVLCSQCGGTGKRPEKPVATNAVTNANIVATTNVAVKTQKQRKYSIKECVQELDDGSYMIKTRFGWRQVSSMNAYEFNSKDGIFTRR